MLDTIFSSILLYTWKESHVQWWRLTHIYCSNFKDEVDKAVFSRRKHHSYYHNPRNINRYMGPIVPFILAHRDQFLNKTGTENPTCPTSISVLPILECIQFCHSSVWGAGWSNCRRWSAADSLCCGKARGIHMLRYTNRKLERRGAWHRKTSG